MKIDKPFELAKDQSRLTQFSGNSRQADHQRFLWQTGCIFVLEWLLEWRQTGCDSRSALPA